MGVPDLKFINRRVPIIEVAQKLGLRVGSNGNIHCWRPDLHQNHDRTASVGICKPANTVKCFGCLAGPLGVVDLVMAVLEMTNPGEAGRWIAERFDVPELPRGKHLVEPARRIFQFGSESEMGLLVQSGLWGQLSPAARSIALVLLELGERVNGTQNRTVRVSYRTLTRFSGVASPNAIRSALQQLEDIHWLQVAPRSAQPGSPVRDTATYLVTPRSNELLELANANFSQIRANIDIEKRLRDEQRKKRASATFTK
jgi:hypothetical protein